MKILERALKAYHNKEFLNSKAARTIRILSEFIEPENRFEREAIEDAIVFFGSARILPPKIAKRNLKEIEYLAKKGQIKEKKTKSLITEARMKLEFSRYYEDCVQLSYLITKWTSTLNKKNHFVVCSGGGPGIMEAANKGAKLANGKSIGLNISLPHEQYPNPYITKELNFEFHYFFMRKLWFAHLAKAMIAFPGGFGTMDELIEVLTLIQTKKIKKRLPIILYGSEFWSNIINFNALIQYGMIAEEDLKMFRIFDSPEKAFLYLKNELTKNYL